MSVFVGGVQAENTAERRDGFLIHAQHHVGHAQVVVSIDMAGMIGYHSLKGRQGAIKVPFKTHHESELPEGVGVLRLLRKNRVQIGSGKPVLSIAPGRKARIKKLLKVHAELAP